MKRATPFNLTEHELSVSYFSHERCHIDSWQKKSFDSINKFLLISLLLMIVSDFSFSQSSRSMPSSSESIVPAGGHHVLQQSTLNLQTEAAGLVLCDIFGSPTACTGGLSLFTGPIGAGYSYSWSVLNNAAGASIVGTTTDDSVHISSGTMGTYDLQLTFTVGGISSICKKTVTVIPGASCFVYPSTNVTHVCPGTTTSYSAPAGMDSYLWTISSGSGTISGSNTSVSVNVVAGNVCDSLYTLTLTFSKSGCNFTCSSTMHIFDNTPPTITLPGRDTTILCSSTPVFTPPTATDDCQYQPTIVLVKDTSIYPLAGPLGTCVSTYHRTLTWKAVDGCGNSSPLVSQTIFVFDNVGPVISSAGNDTTVSCTSPIVFTPPTATDNCDAHPLIVQLSDVTIPGTCPGSYTRTITWKAQDACGNNSPIHKSQTITVRDITPPVIVATGSNTPLGCNPSASLINAALGTATATDSCSTVTLVHTDGLVTATGCSRSQIRTFTATDACGNMATPVSRTATWTSDTITPVITATGTSLTLSCNPTAAAINAALGTATATDNCGPVTPASTDGLVTANGCARSQTRTWTATDACGNVSTPTTRTATWTLDTIAPVITATGTSLTLNCNPTAAAINAALGTATATDNCGPVTPASTDGLVTANGCARSQTRTWTATDACGNIATPVSRTATWTSDTIAPVITATGTSLTLNCNPTAAAINAALGTATATDNCGLVTPASTDGLVTANGCARSQTRTWTATDACGNVSTPTTRTATWTLDTIAPVITATGTSLTLSCNPTASAINAALGTATATDNCGPVTPASTDGLVTANGCARSQTRTWTATDACGNVSTPTTRTATWTLDTIAPVITATGASLVLGCHPSAAAINAALGTATAIDNCGPITPTSIDGSVSTTGCTSSQTRTWSASDACGNVAITVSRTATWSSDSIAPVITCPGNLILSCGSASDTSHTGVASAVDNCTQAIIISYLDSASSTSCTGNGINRIWTATDACGNHSSCMQHITFNDNIAPLILCAADVTIVCGSPSDTSHTGVATATDNCSGVSITFSDAVCTMNCAGGINRTWTAVDAHGNFSGCVQHISFIDNVAPTIGQPGANITVSCPVEPVFIDPTFSDNCSSAHLVIVSDVLIPGPCQGTFTQTRTWIAVDVCGNQSNPVSQSISVVDTTPPVITCGANIVLPCYTPTVTFGTPAVSDSCDGSPTLFIVSDTSVTNASGSRTYTRIWLATDACGNTSGCQQTITVPSLAQTLPTCSLTVPVSLPICGSIGNILCSNATNATAYHWSVQGTGWVITSGINASCITYTAGSDTATFKVVLTGACGNMDSCTVQLHCTAALSNLDLGGCTLGFWKNHSQLWDNEGDPIAQSLANALTALGTMYDGGGVAGSSFARTFGLTNSQMTAAGYNNGLTLLQALNLGGGGFNKLARQGVAALLNTCGLNGHYFYTPAQAIHLIHNAIVSGSAEPLASQLATHNEQQPENCPSREEENDDRHVASALGYGIISDGHVTISAYPNPFDSKATIEFEFAYEVTDVTVEVFNLNGDRVASLFNGTADAGQSYKVVFDGSKLAEGVYVYRVNTADKQYHDKLVLIK